MDNYIFSNFPTQQSKESVSTPNIKIQRGIVEIPFNINSGSLYCVFDKRVNIDAVDTSKSILVINSFFNDTKGKNVHFLTNCSGRFVLQGSAIDLNGNVISTDSFGSESLSFIAKVDWQVITFG